MPDPYSTNPLSYAFWADQPAGSPGGYDALQARRKIAETLLGKRSPFPKTLGEGLTYAGERIADVAMNRDLMNREAADEARQAKDRENFVKGMREASGLAEADTGTPADQTATAPNPVRDQIAAVMTPPPQVPADQGRIPLPPPRPVYDRNRQIAELQANPALQNRILTIAKGEVGDNPQEQQIIAETIMNRAAARDQPLAQVTRQYTGPGSGGYYPASTFGRGAAPLDILSPVLRGSDAGGQTLGFSPTGNASAGVASRGVASGRYSAAGQPPGSAETYVQQERPDQLARLAATRLEGGGGGSPPTMTDIPSAPPGAATAADAAQTAALAATGGRVTDIPSAPPPTVVAQAGAQPPTPQTPTPPASRYGTPLGPFDPRAPEPAPPSAGGVQQAIPNDVLPRPPILRPAGEKEIQALAIAKSSRDTQTRDQYATLAGAYAAQRQAAFDREMTVWNAKKSTIEAIALQKSQAAIAQQSPEAQRRLADLNIAAAEKENDRRLGGSDKEAKDSLGPLYEKVRPVLTAGRTLEQAKAMADKMFTGVGSVNAQAAARYISALPGGDAVVKYFTGKDVTSGQLFEAYMRQMLAPARAIVAGNNNQSNVELETALTSIGAQRNLELGTIKGLLNHAKAMNFDVLHNFQREKSSYSIGKPTDEYVQNRRTTLDTRYPTDLEEHLPDRIVNDLRNNYGMDKQRAIDQFDRQMHAPGLAAKVIEKYRIGQ
jgi:hypothetical protein